MICLHCSKTCFDDPRGDDGPCKQYSIFSRCVGDWVCTYKLPILPAPVRIESTFEFYLVWSPSGFRPPSYRHMSFDSANKEAQRLASLHREKLFFVLKTVAAQLVTEGNIISLDYQTENDIPF